MVFICGHDHLDSGFGDDAVAGCARLPAGRDSRVVLADRHYCFRAAGRPFAKYVQPILPHVGIHDPTVIWLISPLIVFWVLLIPFKSVGFFVHRKVEVYFKYKEDGIQLIRWARLNARLGLGLGLMNGLAYLVLISFIISI